MAELRQRNCVNEIDFYREIEELKGYLKTKDTQKNGYLEHDFYNKAKHFLNGKKQRSNSASQETRIDLSRNN